VSQDTVVEIIVKAFTDQVFRDQLFSEPEKALSKYDLSEDERTSLSNMEGETFDAFASEVDQRISKSPAVPLPYEISQVHQIIEQVAEDMSDPGSDSDDSTS
jgi:carbamate kinase